MVCFHNQLLDFLFCLDRFNIFLTQLGDWVAHWSSQYLRCDRDPLAFWPLSMTLLLLPSWLQFFNVYLGINVTQIYRVYLGATLLFVDSCTSKQFKIWFATHPCLMHSIPYFLFFLFNKDSLGFNGKMTKGYQKLI